MFGFAETGTTFDKFSTNFSASSRFFGNLLVQPLVGFVFRQDVVINVVPKFCFGLRITQLGIRL